MPDTATEGVRYHHGDLRNTVKSAALHVLATHGPAALSLRQVAAQAGVSHTAPRHHFGDKQQLLTEIAADGFAGLEAAMTDALDTASAPHDRLPALLAAYVTHHRTNPGHAAIMWRTDLIDTDDPELRARSLRTFALLHDTVTATDSQTVQTMGPYRLSLMLWSLAHGTADLGDRFTPALATAVGADDPGLPTPDLLVAEFARTMLPPSGGA